MSEALLNKCVVARVLGPTRLRRLLLAGWLRPVELGPSRVLFDPHAVRKALTRLERERCPANLAEVLRVRASELKNGHPRVRKERKPRPTIDEIELDFSQFPESLTGSFRT